MNLEKLRNSPAWDNTEQLVELMKSWSDAYYNDGNSPASDSTYDAAKKRLELLDPYNPYLSVIGAPINSKGEERHKIPMGSLDNLKNEEEFRDWWNKIDPGEVVVQFKYDGLSLGLEYQDGELTRGLVRGDGIFGENKTDNIRRCFHADQINTLNELFTGSVRGEGIVYKEDFTDDKFPGESNPRNSAVGAIRKTNSPRVQWVRMACYDLVNDHQFETEVDKLLYMKQLGLPVCDYQVFDNPDEVVSFYHAVETDRDNIPLMIDGLVVKCNSVAKQKNLGSHKGRPKWAMAFKFPSLVGETTITNIILTVGHTSGLIPTAEYEPVEIEGRTFQHALLDNFDTIEELDLNIGDKIEIEITGDIIPKVRRLISKGSDGHYQRPSRCPFCDSPTQIVGAYTRCTGKSCTRKLIAKVNNWVKKTGIRYLGDSRQSELYESGVIKNPADLYKVTQEDIGSVIGMGNASHVLEEIDKTRTLPLHVFMGSLGIPFLSRSNAQKLVAAGIDTLDKFQNIDPAKTDIPGFGKNLLAIADGINECGPLINELIEAGVFIQEETVAPQAQGDAPTFCFTGVRLGAHKETFSAKGWVEKSSVSKKLDYLVAMDPNSGSKKIEKAQKYGTNIITWNEFMEMLNG